MSGPCMCGDTNCPSCGPAQGHDPAFEVVTEWLLEKVLADMPPIIDASWLAEELANRLGHRDQPQELADVIYETAKQWARDQVQTRRAARDQWLAARQRAREGAAQ